MTTERKARLFDGSAPSPQPHLTGTKVYVGTQLTAAQASAAFQRLGFALVGMSPTREVTPFPYSTPLRGDPSKAGAWVRSSMRGRAYVDGQTGLVHFKRPKDRDAYMVWQNSSRRGGFGGRGVGGGKK